ncbi:MAG: hypothetical protein DMF27_10405 [Verrucomicrobia bacterium]|nr:MAG: hypothetical protein DME37_00130 [Verrucomicrobiota bacterium]PYL75959.1 MAG: hypothetical protein DMF27_10405 [Verrucomicrobiota bacterium]PYM06407.1 MAG: hypothetical protein DMF15_13040 [Verrucomicrobiota bacterium]
MRNYVVMAVEYPLCELLSDELMGGLRIPRRAGRNQTPHGTKYKGARALHRAFFFRPRWNGQAEASSD